MPAHGVAYLPAAAVLGLYAVLLCAGAQKLSHVGAPFLFGAALVFALAAFGLLRARREAFAFAVLFFAVSAALLAAYGLRLAAEALEQGGSDWGGVRRVLIGAVAVSMLAWAALSAGLVPGLVFLRGHLAPGGWTSNLLALVVAASGLAALGWLLGYEVLQRRVYEQNACRAGAGEQCFGLARDEERFTLEERRAFGVEGCARGAASACGWLAGAIDPQDDGRSPVAAMLTVRCLTGKVRECLRLGRQRLGAGDRLGGARLLARACGREALTCSEAARLAADAAAPELSVELLESGCERDDGRSCTGLLRQTGAALGAQERDRLQLKACLLTDVNECLPLIRRDLLGVCPVICHGAEGNRAQSCDHCARHALEAGELELALAWSTAACAGEYRPGCDRMAELRRASGPAVTR